MMGDQAPGTSHDGKRRSLRPHRKLNETNIAAMLEELDQMDISDIDLSDDEDVVDKTYVPADSPDSDDENIELSTESTEDVQDEINPGLVNTTRNRWKINSQFGNDFVMKSMEQNRSVRSPIEYLEEYLPESVYEIMAACTNQRGVSIGKSFNVKKDEIKKFIGLNLYMSVSSMPWLRLHWHRRYGNPIVAATMTRDRFFVIRSNMKVVDDNSVSDDVRRNDRLWKVRPLLDYILRRCLILQRPDTVCIDEQMIPFTGTSDLKQYVPNKPNPEGLKNWVLATPQGLVLDFEVSQGKDHLLKQLCPEDSSPHPGNGEAVVLRLCQSLEQGTRIYFDRYFTTVGLIDKLSNKNLKCTGTIQRNRIPRPCREKLDSVKLDKQARGSSSTVERCDGPPLGITGWYDNKVIIIGSNHEGITPIDNCRRWTKKEKKYIEVERPSVIKNYNDFMGGTDLCDRMISLYRIANRSRKWTVRTIFHFIDLAVVNSWNEYKIDCEENIMPKKNILQFLEFKLCVAEKLMNASSEEVFCSSDDESERPSVRVPLPDVKRRKTSAKHLPEMMPGSEPYHKCRLPNCSKLSRTRYETCGVFLCLNTSRNCFAKFHK